METYPDLVMTRSWNRRVFLAGSAALMSTPAFGAAAVGAGPRAVRSHSAQVGCHWLGRDWWGNRMQDWVRRGSRLVCVAAPAQGSCRVVSRLTTELDGGAATLRVRTGTQTRGSGFRGFLIGTGEAHEDWRHRVLVGQSSGGGGGLFAVYESDGSVSFRDHSGEQSPGSSPQMAAREVRDGRRRGVNDEVELELSIDPLPAGLVQLRLRALQVGTGRVLASTVKTDLPARRVAGGVGLVSSSLRVSDARYWFSGFRASGPGAVRHRGRGLGPIVGTLFALNQGTLKLTAQLMPLDVSASPTVALQLATATGWRTVRSVKVGSGYAASFRVPGWDAGREVPYRVVVSSHPHSPFGGRIPAEPAVGELTIASVSCTRATNRRTDSDERAPARLPGETSWGRYSAGNINFPFASLTSGIRDHSPDLLVAHGDQYYETSPTAPERGPNPEIDALSRHVLWLWSFRPLTRSTPTIVLVDDHDVYQGNIWGDGGRPAVSVTDGGYVRSPAWVNTIQRMQCGHNPDAWDPTPTRSGVGVYYGAFRYAGFELAFLEDRKFKSPPPGGSIFGDTPETDPDDRQLLGVRQERFLANWGAGSSPRPRVVLSQTAFATLQTEPDGTPRRDRDTNGWPRAARNRAVELIEDAGAIVLAGDQHLGTLVRLGRPGQPSPADGPWQITGPAGAATFQRWLEPTEVDADGLWTDAFGNVVQIHAVVPAQVTYAQVAAARRGNGILDPLLRRDGFSLVRLSDRTQTIDFEIWARSTRNMGDRPRLQPGFPHVVDYSEV